MIRKSTIQELLSSIDARLGHLEDIEADNRKIIIKLVKQGNQIVSFLKQLEIDDVTDEYVDKYFDEMSLAQISNQEKLELKKLESLKELVDNFMEKQEDLKEFEEELKKHKDDITPGTVGES